MFAPGSLINLRITNSIIHQASTLPWHVTDFSRQLKAVGYNWDPKLQIFPEPPEGSICSYLKTFTEILYG